MSVVALSPETQELLKDVEAAIALLTKIREVGRQLPSDNYNPISATTQKHMTIVIQNLSASRGDIANGIVRNHMGYEIESGVDVLAVAKAKRDSNIADIIDG